MCLVENVSVAATRNNRNTEVTIEVIKCKPFEKCVDANTDIGGQKYGYNILYFPFIPQRLEGNF